MSEALLDSIQTIHDTSDAAEISVLESLVDVYTKACVIFESVDDETDLSAFGVFQEGFKDFISDANAPITGKSGESIVKKILMFIPRLIAKIVRMVQNAIKKLSRRGGLFDKKESNKEDPVSEITPDENSDTTAKTDDTSQPHIDFHGEMGDLPKLEGFKSFEDAELYLKSRKLKCEGSYDEWIKDLRIPGEPYAGNGKRATDSADTKVWYRISSPKGENGSYCIMPFCNMKMVLENSSHNTHPIASMHVPSHVLYIVNDTAKSLSKNKASGHTQMYVESLTKKLRGETKSLKENISKITIVELSICDEYERSWTSSRTNNSLSAFKEVPQLLNQFKEYMRKFSDAPNNSDDYSGMFNNQDANKTSLTELFEAINTFLISFGEMMAYVTDFVTKLDMIILTVRKELG